jgi:hypothetical protein
MLIGTPAPEFSPRAAMARRRKMKSIMRKSAAGALAALVFTAGMMTAATPSHAGWRGYGWRHGYRYPGYGWRRGYGWGGAAAAGALGGFALGALAGSAYAYGPGYYGYGCHWQNQPTYDGWGNFAGYQPVWVCN